MIPVIIAASCYSTLNLIRAIQGKPPLVPDTTPRKIEHPVQPIEPTKQHEYNNPYRQAEPDYITPIVSGILTAEISQEINNSDFNGFGGGSGEGGGVTDLGSQK